MAQFRRILVTAHCQTPGLASALRLLFPEAEVYTRGTLAKKDADPADVSQLLSQLDAWINVEAGADSFAGGEFAQSHPQLRYVSVPLIEFPAFHPDVCAVQGTGPEPVRTKYTSVIGAWAYRNELGAQDAVAAFNLATYANLGYLSLWERSVERLREAFDKSSLAEYFGRFYLRIKRLGLFMYSATHPRQEVLAEMAKLIALKLGKEERLVNVDLPALDVLSHFIWPVYPEIAQYLSVRSSGYVWQWPDGPRIEGLEKFLTYSFDHYRTHHLTPASITVPGVDLEKVGRAVVMGS